MTTGQKTRKVEFIESYIKIGNGDYRWNDNHGELIRCRDCRFKECDGRDGQIVCDITGEPHDPSWYCAAGER